jgi:hypothetical protein
MSDETFAGWRKSRRSGDGNSCVEVAATVTPRPRIGVRDSKRHGHGPILEFSTTAWQEFLSRLKA